MSSTVPDPAVHFRSAVADRYAIEHELGSGGMATVYLARDLRHERSVAIKVLRGEIAAAVGSERFLYEIKITANLNHPNILPLLDSGEADGFLFYAMPYVQGGSLRTRLNREKQLPLEEALDIAVEVAEALSSAHRNNVVHRDIKPENVLLEEGHAVVADFGIARAVEAAGGDRLTGEGLTVGTPPYMSPEQCAGAGAIDGRSDIYSLGCVLYEMLAGEPPFTGSYAQAIIARHVSEQPPSLRIVRPTASAELQAVVEKSLAKAPADRFPTAERFARVLASVQPQSHKPHKPIRWRPIGVTLALFVALAAFLVFRPDNIALASGPSIVVFPLQQHGDVTDSPDGDRPRPAHEFASAIKWIPGVQTMEVPEPASSPASQSQISPSALVKRARDLDGDYFSTGELRAGPQGTVVTLALHSARTGEQVYRGTAGGRGESTARALERLAMEAVLELMRAGDLELQTMMQIAASTTSPRALAHLMRGQRYYGTYHPDMAVKEYQRAVQADSEFAVAFHRMSVAHVSRYDYRSALDAVRRGLAIENLEAPWSNLLQAQRDYVLRNATAATAGFQRIVLDYPDLPDAWLGLGESLMYMGAYVGHSLTDARAAYESLVAIDSGFAPIHGRLVALALLQGDWSRGERSFRGMPRDDRERAVWAAALELSSGDEQQVSRALRSMATADRPTLSLLFAFLTRRKWGLVLADSIAGYLMGPDRTPDDRLRGAQYRLVALTAQQRWREAQRVWSRVAQGLSFDRWVVAAYLAGYDAADLARPMLEWSRNQVHAGVAPNFSRPTDDVANQAFRALVHAATLWGDSAEAGELLAALDAARQPDESNPLPAGLRSSLRARLALLASDTTRAVAYLDSAVARPGSPWIAFFPLTALGPQRLLLARLLARLGRAADAERWLNSFDNTWSVGDALYAARLTELRQEIIGITGTQTSLSRPVVEPSKQH
ncbi:MAG: protein kinase [Gemmatimonadales bacterium]